MRELEIKKIQDKPTVIHIKDKPKLHVYQPEKPSIKAKNNSIKMAGIVGAKVATENVEGGKELRESGMLAYRGVRPIVNTVSKGASQFRKKAISKRRKYRIKKVESSKKISKKAIKRTFNRTSKKAAKDTTKQSAKLALKLGVKTMGTAVGTATTGPGGILIGMATGVAIDKKDIKNSSKNRMMTFFLNKMKQDNDNQESIGKMVKDLIMMRVSMAMKYIATYVGGFLLLLVLLISIVALPAIAVVALIYNSPFAIFFPPLEAGDTVMSMTSAYVQEFNRDVSTLANSHSGYDQGKIVYVNYEGDSAEPSNYYDIMSVYMVQHGVGETATVMNDKSKGWLKEIFDDMSTYATSSGTETIENQNGTTSTVTILYVNVTLKSYREMIGKYNFNEEKVNLLEEMMRSANLASLGFTGGSGGINSGSSQSSMSNEETQSVLNGIPDTKLKSALSYALSKVGYPYSQDYRDSGDYFDCSSLAYYSWKAAGVDISFSGATTAAAEGQGLDEAGKTVLYDEIKPGDLIFYSYCNNGRYKNISHVVLYCGNGKVVEAANESTGVVYGDVPSIDKIILVGRP